MGQKERDATSEGTNLTKRSVWNDIISTLYVWDKQTTGVISEGTGNKNICMFCYHYHSVGVGQTEEKLLLR